jgi:hypothetical protein
MPVLKCVKPLSESNSRAGSPLYSDDCFAGWLEAERNWIMVLALVTVLFWTVFYLQFTVDDAFISFRYGKNLVALHLWNWNPSGAREEAYTSALYTLLSVIPAFLHISPALFFKIVGLACVGALLYRLHTLSRSRFAVLLGTLLIALHPWVWLHAFAGLETPLYILLLLEMALAVHMAPTASAAWVYTVFLLLPLTRPEGIVFALVGVGLFWYHRGNAHRNYAAFAAACVLGLFYFFARWRYFHHFLPNPYYFKLAPSTWAELTSSFLNNLTAFKGYFLVLLLAGVFSRQCCTRIFAVCGVLLLLLLYAPHDMHMNYADRFYFQVMFPFLLFFLIAEDLVPIARVAAVLVVISLFSITVPYLRQGLRYFPFRTQSDIDLALRLAPFAKDHTILTPNAGAIPYYSNWISYDFFGLGTYRISHDGLSLPLLAELHPDLILVESTQPGPGVLNEDTYPAKNTEIAFLKRSGEYEYVGESGTGLIYNIEFLRKDTPRHEEIVRALRENMRVSSASHLSLQDLLLQRYVRWED